MYVDMRIYIYICVRAAQIIQSGCVCGIYFCVCACAQRLCVRGIYIRVFACVCACGIYMYVCCMYMKRGEFHVVMFLFLSVGQSKRNKIIKEVIEDVKKRWGKRSAKSSDQQQINQSMVQISETSKVKGISKDTFKMACTHKCISNVKNIVRRQIDV